MRISSWSRFCASAQACGGRPAFSLVGWLIWGANFWRDVSRDPTAHNLFPFEILTGAFGGAVYLGLLFAIRSVRHARA
jgi:hypothetical protein